MPLTLDESREFRALCKSGKLYQVQEWIDAGRSTTVHPNMSDTRMDVALRTGFFSLLELSARHCDSQDELDGVLLQAVRRQNFDAARIMAKGLHSPSGGDLGQ